MRKLIILGLFVGVTALSGCNGVVKSYDDRKNQYSRTMDYDFRQLVDDWDAIWLADRQYRLTQWHTR